MTGRPTTIVHNPLRRLKAAERLAALPIDQQEILRDLLLEISAEAAIKAEHCWRRHKAPMAVYWKAVAVYAKHASRLFRVSRRWRSFDAKAAA